MRMVHYYLALAIVLAPCLLATLATGAFHDGSDRHLVLGLFTALLCVATDTLLILFMIVSGRILKVAVQARALGPEFLGELNLFFARKKAYPAALLSAFLATAAAVLGYGRFIGVPGAVHVLVGLAAALANLLALPVGVSTLRSNQRLLDRAARELDRQDLSGSVVVGGAGEPQWAFRRSTRWLVFAVSAWGPYLYWSLVVWRGEFSRVAPLFPILTLAVSALGLFLAWHSRRQPAS